MYHIGIDARLTYYHGAGTATYIRRLVSAFEDLVGHDEYTIFQSRKMTETLSQRFRRANLYTPSHHRLERLALSVELAPYRLDLLHSPDFIPPLRGARRHVITVHDLNFLYYPQLLTPESRRYYNNQINAAVRDADHILADSQATYDDLVSLLDVPPEKITIHMLGVDSQFRPPSPEELVQNQQALQLPTGYLLFVGSFEPRKNISGLLTAYRQLLDDGETLPPLVLAGRKGWLFEETMQRITDLHLDEHILWRADVPQPLMPTLYHLASALILPSFYEGFGFPALEAMACGTVPIVSNRASLPEVVGDVGTIIDPDSPATLANAIKRTLSDAQWRHEQEQAGLTRATTFTWQKTAETVLSVYNAIL